MAYGKQNGREAGQTGQGCPEGQEPNTEGKDTHSSQGGKDCQRSKLAKPALLRAEQSLRASFSQLILTELPLCGSTIYSH